MVKKITGVILVLMLMLGVLCGCVQQADSDWGMPEDKYTGLEEFRLICVTLLEAFEHLFEIAVLYCHLIHLLDAVFHHCIEYLNIAPFY